MSQVDEKSPMLAPMRHRSFRLLWSVAFIANVCTWMSDVSAAWMMTTLTTDALWVGLVQTASMLPVFLLGLPSGALADSFDRKQYLLLTQAWVTGIAALLSAAVFLGWMSPLLLLLLTFASGIGLAMRMPVLAAVVPELVPRLQLPAAMALNSVSMNVSRIIGPILAGMLIASAGTAWVFLLNAILSVLTVLLISRWKREAKSSPLGREPLGTAMRVGWQYVAQSHHLKGVLLRLGIFFFCTSALTAMLPLLARKMGGENAVTFTVLLASMGGGAVVSVSFLPGLRARYGRDALVLRGTVLQALIMLLMGWADQLWLAAPAMFLCGAAWLTVGNALSVAAQQGLPDWVRARGMSLSQMAVMGGSALGAAFWGQISNWSTVSVSLAIAAGIAVLGMAWINHLWPETGKALDLTPQHVPLPTKAAELQGQGRVMVTIEYRIDPACAQKFRALMLEASRPSKLRHGALAWQLLHDMNDPGRFVEMITDASWADYLRRFERLTVADVELRQRKQAFHLGNDEPRVCRHFIESSLKGD